MSKASYRWLFGIVAMLSLLLWASPSFADGDSPIRLVIDDQTVISDVPPINIKGRLFLPARTVAERLGGQLFWDGEKQQVRIVRRSDEVVLTINSDTALVNGVSTKLDAPAVIIDGRTVVPIRFVATALGATVKYDGETRTAFVWRRPTIITGVFWEKEVGQARITLRLSEPLAYTVQEGPGGFALDLQPAVLQVPQPVNVLTDPLFKSISLFQTGERQVGLQVETHTKASPKVALSPDGTQLTITTPYQVTGIQYVQDGNVPTVLIPTNGPVAYTTTQVGGPDRLVVDIPGVTLAADVPREVPGGSLVQRVRAAQSTAEGGVRVVLDLVGHQPYQVVSTRAGLMVRYVPIVSAITLQDQKNGTATLQVKTNLPVTYSVSPPTEGSKTLTLTIPGVRTYLPDDQDLGLARVHLDRSQGKDGLTVTVQLSYYLGHTVGANPGPTGPAISFVTSPIYGKKIWVDAGHGGSDPGAIGPGGTREKDVTLAVALKLQKLLQNAGAQVLMTRTDDTLVDFRAVPDLVNKAGPDMFLSIHLNSASGQSARGTETYYWSTNPKSKPLADAIQSALVAGLGTIDRGVRVEDYWVVKYTKSPAVLAELGFLSNPTEEAFFLTPATQEKAAEALRQGIFKFFLGN
jgi:N-acetylmuramoyl-L-alanine amidase